MAGIARDRLSRRQALGVLLEAFSAEQFGANRPFDFGRDALEGSNRVHQILEIRAQGWLVPWRGALQVFRGVIEGVAPANAHAQRPSGSHDLIE